MFDDIMHVITVAGSALVGPLVAALRAGDADKAAQAARVVAETIAFKRALQAARK